MKKNEIDIAGLVALTGKSDRTMQKVMAERGAPKPLRRDGNARVYNRRAAKAFLIKRALGVWGLA